MSPTKQHMSSTISKARRDRTYITAARIFPSSCVVTHGLSMKTLDNVREPVNHFALRSASKFEPPYTMAPKTWMFAETLKFVAYVAVSDKKNKGIRHIPPP